MKKQNIAEVYKEYAQQVYKYLFCLTHDDGLAEDLTQETFYIAVKHIDQFRGECKIYVWLCQIAKNLYYKYLKKNKKILKVPFENIENGEIHHNIENNSIDKLDIYNRIDRLDERTREVIYLRLMGDLSFKEIGELLRISESSARIIFYRGKEKIKEEESYEKE